MGPPRVVGVLAENVGAIWDTVEPWIGSAVDRDGLLGSDDVRASIEARDMQLWLVIDDRPVACCVTEISLYPKAKVLGAVAVGGKGAARWIKALNDQLTRYAEAHGCTKFNAPVARRGWRPLARALGWSERATYWKDIHVE